MTNFCEVLNPVFALAARPADYRGIFRQVVYLQGGRQLASYLARGLDGRQQCYWRVLLLAADRGDVHARAVA